MAFSNLDPQKESKGGFGIDVSYFEYIFMFFYVFFGMMPLKSALCIKPA